MLWVIYCRGSPALISDSNITHYARKIYMVMHLVALDRLHPAIVPLGALVHPVMLGTIYLADIEHSAMIFLRGIRTIFAIIAHTSTFSQQSCTDSLTRVVLSLIQ